VYKKNVSGQHFTFQGVDVTTGGDKSGVSWTVRRCIDGTFAAATGTVTEDGTTGWYKFAMSQADTNGNNIGFNFRGTGAVPQTVNIITDGAPPDVNLKSILGTVLTETAGQIAAAFKQFFDVASPTGTMKAITSVTTLVEGSAEFYTDVGQYVWDQALTSISVPSSIGKLIEDNLDAAITTRATPAQVNTEVDTALADYDAPTKTEMDSAFAALNDLDAVGVRDAIGLETSNLDIQLDALPTAAEINAEVVDALNVDTYAEPGQEAPGATISLAKKISYLYKAFRNKVTQTSTTMSLFADDASTVDQKATVSSDGSTFTRNEIGSGP
jgi:hypothetical protein